LFSLIWRGVKGDHGDFTSGSINHAIVLLSVPMILEMGMESIFAVVDVYFVSRLNDNDALAAVGLTESVLSLIYSLAFGLSMGATALVARRVGEKDERGAEDAAVQALFLGLFVTAALTIAGLLYADDVLRFMGGS